MSLLQVQWENFFLPNINPNEPNFVSFLVFVGTAASFTAKISSSKTVANEEPFWIPYQKWISKDIWSYGSQSECAKIAIHWFGEY